MRHSDVVVGIVLLTLCALIYWVTTGFPEVPAMLSQNVPPTFFPRLVVTIVAALSGILILVGLRKDPVSAPAIPPVVFVTAGIVIAAGFLVEWIGTLPTLSLIAVCLPLAWGERRLPRIGLLAVGLPSAIYVVFSMALGIRFPAGQLFNWLT